ASDRRARFHVTICHRGYSMSDSEIVARRRAEFVAAFNREDIETASDYVTDDVVTMAPNQAARHGRDAARAFWRDSFAQAETRLRVISADVQVSGDIAVDRFQWTLDMAPRSGGT